MGLRQSMRQVQSGGSRWTGYEGIAAMRLSRTLRMMHTVCRTVTIITTLAEAPSGRRKLQQMVVTYNRTYTTNADSAGQFATFSQASPYSCKCPANASRCLFLKNCRVWEQQAYSAKPR